MPESQSGEELLLDSDTKAATITQITVPLKTPVIPVYICLHQEAVREDVAVCRAVR